MFVPRVACSMLFIRLDTAECITPGYGRIIIIIYYYYYYYYYY